MFDSQQSPRVFGLPPGIDFPAAFVNGFLARSGHLAPEIQARTEIYVNTRRMQRRMRELFSQGPARLLPRIRLVTEIGQSITMADVPPAVPPLRRRLELSQLIGQLLENQPDLAARSSIFDLADSLATLMDEMHGEGVLPETIEALDVTDQSGHWQRALEFFRIVQRYFGESAEAPDGETRQRLAIERLVAGWQANPPRNPVIIAGSTGSRGATHMLMQAVARLPSGAIVFPGFDFDLPANVWSMMDDALSSEDHPQFRFRKLLTALDLGADDVAPWSEDTPPSPERNRLLSLALRPAPVTDQWLEEGHRLTGLDRATANVTLLEAKSGRQEALAIALRLRKAAETGQTAALITPDRVLTRQVATALDQWGIEPDDSAGMPLQVTAPGRFLRHVSALFGRKLTSEALLTLLKHPLTNTGGKDRGQHLLWTRELELKLRRYGPAFPDAADIAAWAKTRDGGDPILRWASWLSETVFGLEDTGTRSVAAHLEHHLKIAAALATGPDGTTTGELWEKPAGRAALETVEALQREAGFGGKMSASDYAALFNAVLGKGEVRDPVQPHLGIMVWGTLEARVQGSDLVILAGLNDGTWPELPKPDPWLSRKMRLEAGLLLPERRIGLSAHDFQQAAAANEVWLSRSIRDSEAETVASRWLNRMTNLLGGLKDQGGTVALADMRARGQDWLSLVAALEAPAKNIAKAPRPSPRPPVAARPKRLSVTRIRALIRDPYSIYAQYILKLRPLDPLKHMPDAPLRGTVLHHIFERFIRERDTETHAQAKARLMKIAGEILENEVPWPAAQRIWLAKLARVADWFLATEDRRCAQAESRDDLLEVPGKARLDGLDFELTATADRIDVTQDGAVYIYDYKTGAPPSGNAQKYFDKQLLLEAAMVERGAFRGLDPSPVRGAAYIGLGSNPKEQPAPLENVSPDQIWHELHRLIGAYMQQSRGYTSRRAMAQERFGGDYDHLARFGEWDETDTPDGGNVG